MVDPEKNKKINCDFLENVRNQDEESLIARFNSVDAANCNPKFSSKHELSESQLCKWLQVCRNIYFAVNKIIFEGNKFLSYLRFTGTHDNENLSKVASGNKVTIDEDYIDQNKNKIVISEFAFWYGLKTHKSFNVKFLEEFGNRNYLLEPVIKA